MINEGQTATNPKTGQKIVYKGGEWHALPASAAPAASVSDPAAPGSSFFSQDGRAPKLTPQDNAFLSKQRTATQNAQSMRADANRFIELNKGTSTGGFAMQVPVLRNIAKGVGRAMDPKFDEMNAITEKVTPLMREAGSGVMSDRDVEMYRASTIGVDKLGPTNQAIAGVIDGGARRQGDYQAFLEEWAKRNGGLVGAQEAWSSYADANPMFDRGQQGTTQLRKTTPWRQWFGVERQMAPAQQQGAPAGPGQQQPRVRRYNPATGNLE